MDSRLLKKKQEFKELKDTYVIFICQHDKFKENKPIYHVDKIVIETGKVFDDGAHIIYVNGKYRGEDDFGKLAHDFNCKKADKVADERAEQTKVDIVKSLMINMKWTLDEALTVSGIQGKERAIIAKQLQK